MIPSLRLRQSKRKTHLRGTTEPTYHHWAYNREGLRSTTEHRSVAANVRGAGDIASPTCWLCAVCPHTTPARFPPVLPTIPSRRLARRTPGTELVSWTLSLQRGRRNETNRWNMQKHLAERRCNEVGGMKQTGETCRNTSLKGVATRSAEWNKPVKHAETPRWKAYQFIQLIYFARRIRQFSISKCL